jgi:hypothetical protein
LMFIIIINNIAIIIILIDHKSLFSRIELK